MSDQKLGGHRSPPAWPGEDASQDGNWADEWLQNPVVAMLNEAAGKAPADKNAEVRHSTENSVLRPLSKNWLLVYITATSLPGLDYAAFFTRSAHR